MQVKHIDSTHFYQIIYMCTDLLSSQIRPKISPRPSRAETNSSATSDMSILSVASLWVFRIIK